MFSEVPKRFNSMPELVERLIKDLVGKGYIVIHSSARYMGIPQSITVIKDFTGPFVTQLSTKIQDDFKALSKQLGIGELFK